MESEISIADHLDIMKVEAELALKAAEAAAMRQRAILDEIEETRAAIGRQ